MRGPCFEYFSPKHLLWLKFSKKKSTRLHLDIIKLNSMSWRICQKTHFFIFNRIHKLISVNKQIRLAINSIWSRYFFLFIQYYIFMTQIGIMQIWITLRKIKEKKVFSCSTAAHLRKEVRNIKESWVMRHKKVPNAPFNWSVF